MTRRPRCPVVFASPARRSRRRAEPLLSAASRSTPASHSRSGWRWTVPRHRRRGAPNSERQSERSSQRECGGSLHKYSSSADVTSVCSRAREGGLAGQVLRSSNTNRGSAPEFADDVHVPVGSCHWSRSNPQESPRQVPSLSVCSDRQNEPSGLIPHRDRCARNDRARGIEDSTLQHRRGLCRGRRGAAEQGRQHERQPVTRSLRETGTGLPGEVSWLSTIFGARTDSGAYQASRP